MLNRFLGLMEEYGGHTSLYAQCTSQIACMLSIKLSTPRVLSQEGFGMLGFGVGHLLGLVVLGPIGLSGFGLIIMLERPSMDLGPI